MTLAALRPALAALGCGLLSAAPHAAAAQPQPGLALRSSMELAQAGGPTAPDAAATSGPKALRTEAEIGYGRETLSNNRPDWKNLYLEMTHRIGDRHVVYGGLRETRRFGLDDTEAHLGLYYPLAPTWTGVIEGSLSPTHDVLPRHSLYGQLHKSLPGGWGVALGLRHSEYDASGVNVVSLLAERYWGNFRGAYTLYSGRPEGASSGASHRFQLSYYYGDRDSIGLSYSTGREVENTGPPAGILTSDVRSWTLTGRHWFVPGWAVTYELLAHEQGNLYRRQGLRLGVRHSF